MTQETTPVMNHRGLRPETRDNRRKGGMTRQEFDLLVESCNGGKQYAARLTPEIGGWACVATVDGVSSTGRGASVNVAFSDALGGRLRVHNTRRAARGAWTATITDLDGNEYAGTDATPLQAVEAAYSEFTSSRGLSRMGGF